MNTFTDYQTIVRFAQIAAAFGYEDDAKTYRAGGVDLVGCLFMIYRGL